MENSFLIGNGAMLQSNTLFNRNAWVFGAGGAYAFGKASVAVSYTHTRQSQSQYFASAANPAGADISFDIAELNTTYMLAPDLQLGLAYIFNDAKSNGAASTRVHQINLGAVYSLSKRTAVYAVAIGQKSSGGGLGINPSTGQTENLAQIPNIVNSDTDKQLSVIVGVRHNF